MYAERLKRLRDEDIFMTEKPVQIVMEEITDPEELVKAGRNERASIAIRPGCKPMPQRCIRVTAANVSVLRVKNSLSPIHLKKY
jgi:hypothetical protein